MDDNIQEMIEEFAFLDDWEDRYMHVIELGKALPPLTDNERNDVHKVKGCVSQVWLVSIHPSNDNISAPVNALHYKGDSDAHIVKGLVAVVLELFSGKTPKQILAIDATAILSQLGLAEHLTVQRSNGLNAMITRIQRDAKAALNA